LARGLRREDFANIFISGSVTDWKQLFPETTVSEDTSIKVYTRSDASGAADVWAEYIDEKAQEDLLGIGFNNVGFAYDPGTLEPLSGLLIIPIDLNENGVIDPEEDFYARRDGVTGAIADGIYPSPPASSRW
jgi:phosphate transport system substrate-binding protein